MTAQIKHYKPDVLLNAAINGISTDFLQGIKPHVKLLVGEHAATRLPETGNWSVYDLVISSFPPTLDWFRSKGVPAELSRLAFEPRVLSHLKKNGERKIARKSRHVPRRPHEATRQRNCPRLSSSGHRAFQSPPSPGCVMHAHAWRPGANQVHDHLVACLCAMHFAQLSPRPPIGSSKDFYVTAFA
jgi:hypothetical protein